MNSNWFELDDKVLNSHHLAVNLIDLATNRGGDRENLLRGTGLFYEDLVGRQVLISSAQIYRLIANIEKARISNDLSFLAGRRLFPGQLASVGSLLVNGRTLGDMLRILLCYQQQVFPLAYFRVERHHNNTYLLLNNAVSNAEGDKFILELVCAAIYSGSKWRADRQIPLHFYFQFPRPRNIYQYEANLGSRLNFDQHLNMIQIENQWLTKPLVDSSSILRNRFRRSCSEYRRNHSYGVGLIQYVAKYIERNISCNLELVAAYLMMSPATLKRKLKFHGTSFSKIQDEVRRQQAVFDLQVRGSNNQQTANRLSFTDLPNFRRSLKRWTGATPSDLRQA